MKYLDPKFSVAGASKEYRDNYDRIRWSDRMDQVRDVQPDSTDAGES